MTLLSRDQIHRPRFGGVWNEDLLEVAQVFDEIRAFLERLQSGEIDTRLLDPQVETAVTYSIKDTDAIVVVTSNVTVTLPTAVGKKSNRYYVKRSTAAGAVTVATTGAETIDGAATYSLATNYDAVTVVSDGANWLSL